MLDLAPEVDALGFWINTELHEGDDSQLNISLDGIEMFHFFDGKRPAFYAVKFLRRLKGVVVAEGADFIMTKHTDGYQLILMNCANINPRYSVEERFTKEEQKELHIRITGLQAGNTKCVNGNSTAIMGRFTRNIGSLIVSMDWIKRFWIILLMPLSRLLR